MKKRIITAFALIFILFTLGSGVLLYNLFSITSDLRYLIGLHEIEDIRQELSFSIQNVQAYTYASGIVFSEHLDEIITNTEQIDYAINKCFGCHHTPAVQAEIESINTMVSDFKEKLSYLITTIKDDDRRLQKQSEVSALSKDIIGKVQQMIKRAGSTIQRRTDEAMNEIHQNYALLSITLFSTFVLAFFIAHYLTKSITGPIDALVSATRKIADGNWGYKADYEAADEFGELIDTFNEMSISLEKKKKQIQSQLEELKNTQNHLIEAEKLTAIGTLAGGIAHDFNNILCGMIGHLNLLKKKLPPDNQYLTMLNTIEEAGFRAAELIKQLLAFARQKTLEERPIAINDCITTVLSLLQNTLGKTIAIKLDLGTHLPQITGDTTQLEQVIMNLCLNARDAMMDGGVLLITTDAVTLDEPFCLAAEHTDAEPGEFVRMLVTDTGSGIDEKTLPRIFEPFYTTKEIGKGTGLGLAMVYGIVKSHKGFCLVDSILGMGTTFSIYLPAAVEAEEKKPAPAPATQSVQGEYTVLIVDNEAIITSMLVEHLHELRCSVLLAATGREAISIFSQHKKEIDLIILDINLPVMDGKDVYAQIKELKPDVKVLVSSGYTLNERAHDILQHGAQGYIQKPYRMDDIIALIRGILQGH